VTILGNVERILRREAQEAAFGRPGEPGNIELIEHLSRRIVSVYEDLLDWALTVRATPASADVRGLIECTAALADAPIRQTRSFIGNAVALGEDMMARYARGEAVHVVSRLTVSIDDDALKAFRKEQKRVQRRVR
jgi:hypothetical protein